MADLQQVNVQVPPSDQAREVIKEVARRIRKEPGFLAHLGRWLQEEVDATRTAFLADRVGRLEERVGELSRLAGLSGKARAKAQTDMFEERQALVPASAPAAPALPVDGERSTDLGEGPSSGPWAKGEGRGRRLTEEGRQEMARRIFAGQTDREIADFLGIKPFSVTNFRKAKSAGGAE